MTERMSQYPLPRNEWFYFDGVNYRPLIDEHGVLQLRVTGQSVKDYFTGNTTIHRFYDTPMNRLSIVNDGEADISFTIGTMTITVKPSEYFDSDFDPFTEITVTAISSFRAIVKG